MLLLLLLHSMFVVEGRKGSGFLPEGLVVYLNPRPLLQGSQVQSSASVQTSMALYASELMTGMSQVFAILTNNQQQGML